MSVTIHSIAPQALAQLQASGEAFNLIDVRRAAARHQDGSQIAGGVWQDPAAWLDWKDSVPNNTPAVVYCAKGHEISQAMAATLAALGVDACYLEGGILEWKAAGLAVETAMLRVNRVARSPIPH